MTTQLQFIIIIIIIIITNTAKSEIFWCDQQGKRAVEFQCFEEFLSTAITERR